MNQDDFEIWIDTRVGLSYKTVPVINPATEDRMSFLNAMRGLTLTRQQQETIVAIDPVLKSRLAGTERGKFSLQQLQGVVGLTPEQVTNLLVACADDLFAVHKNIAAYAHLLEADRLDNGRRAINAAIKHCQLAEFVINFGLNGVTDQDCVEAIPQWIYGDQTMFRSVIACVDMMSDGRLKASALEELLRAVIEEGELDQARSCLKKLGRNFKITEARFLAIALLSDSDLTKEELEFAGKYGRPRDRHAFFAYTCEKKSASWLEITELARGLRVDITKKYLRAILKNHGMDNMTKITAAEYLVCWRDSRALRAKLDELYLQERRERLVDFEIVGAEEYGSKIGAPLTPDELLVFIREWNDSTADNAICYKPHIPWARELLLARLQNPSAPAPPAPEPE